MSLIMGMHWEPNRRITQRQWDIWRLVSHGMNNDEIATELGYSAKIVQYDVGQLYDKLLVPDGSARRVKLALMFPVQVLALEEKV